MAYINELEKDHRVRKHQAYRENAAIIEAVAHLDAETMGFVALEVRAQANQLTAISDQTLIRLLMRRVGSIVNVNPNGPCDEREFLWADQYGGHFQQVDGSSLILPLQVAWEVLEGVPPHRL